VTRGALEGLRPCGILAFQKQLFLDELKPFALVVYKEEFGGASPEGFWNPWRYVSALLAST
jgi:hypothetical protein